MSEERTCIAIRAMVVRNIRNLLDDMTNTEDVNEKSAILQMITQLTNDIDKISELEEPLEIT